METSCLTSATLDSALTLLTMLSTCRNESKRGSFNSGGSLYNSSSIASHNDAILLSTFGIKRAWCPYCGTFTSYLYRMK